MFRSVSYKLGAILGGFVIFILGSVFSTFWAVNSQKSDSPVINLAGRQRMLTQKMSKEALGVQKGVEMEKYREQLRQTADMFDHTLKALVTGGKAPSGDGGHVILPPTKNHDILKQLQKVQSSWERFHQAVKTVLEEDPAGLAFIQAVETIEAMSNPLLKEMNKAVGMYERESARKISRLKGILVGFLLAGLVLAVVGYLVTNRIVANPIKRLAEQAQAVARGDLSSESLRIRTRDEIGALANSFREMTDALQNLVAETRVLIQASQDGKLDQRANADKFQGVYRDLVEGINGTLDAVVAPINEAAEVLQKVAAGDLKSRMKGKYKGDFSKIKEALNKAVSNLSEAFSRIEAMKDEQVKTMESLIAETKMLIDSARDGQLDTRADATKFEGEPRELIEALNEMLDTIVRPLREASAALERVAARDLTVRMEGDYRGEFAKIKEALNKAVKNLDEGLTQVAIGADQVASAAGQISAGSQSLAQGTSEQASSLEEVSSSLQEMASMTRQNAANAKEARGLSDGARSSAEKGSQSMARLSEAMDKIKVSADETAKIVKTIDEIAFQTNLLALNAAVEAARAGDAGKGFAVVAEEVRNLAMRSAEAAKTTADLIEESVNNAENGVVLNQEVLKNLEEINDQVNKVSTVMTEITAASEQQSQGIEQITTAVEQMNQVTQQTAANAEESAAAAEELSGQAAEMQSMVTSFQLTDVGSVGRSVGRGDVGGRSEGLTGSPVKVVTEAEVGLSGTEDNGGAERVDPESVIPFKDEDDMDVLKEF
jgi:methyl-accepting chemotaxis protein